MKYSPISHFHPIRKILGGQNVQIMYCVTVSFVKIGTAKGRPASLRDINWFVSDLYVLHLLSNLGEILYNRPTNNAVDRLRASWKFAYGRPYYVMGVKNLLSFLRAPWNRTTFRKYSRRYWSLCTASRSIVVKTFVSFFADFSRAFQNSHMLLNSMKILTMHWTKLRPTPGAFVTSGNISNCATAICFLQGAAKHLKSTKVACLHDACYLPGRSSIFKVSININRNQQSTNCLKKPFHLLKQFHAATGRFGRRFVGHLHNAETSVDFTSFWHVEGSIWKNIPDWLWIHSSYICIKLCGMFPLP